MNSYVFGFCLLLAGSPPAGGGLQTDHLEEYADQVEHNRKSCGPTALWYCFRQFGLDVVRADLCREASIGVSGTNLETLLKLCRDRGIYARAITCPTTNLDTLPVPSILVVDQTHCVVYQGIGEDGVTVSFFEPAKGRVLTAPRDKVVRNWTGEAIVFDRPRLQPLAFWGVVASSAVIAGLLATVCWRIRFAFGRA
jgi:ABC-type bacteriocin/lantibiotic exporter with double-glycine peptidase domain